MSVCATRSAASVALTLLAALPLAQAGYRFTFSNAAAGTAHAPALLEYFSMVDCGPCRQFELEELPALLPAVESGQLRIVFRDLPPPSAYEAEALHLFCLQETEDFLAARLEAKRSGEYIRPQTTLRDRRLARWQECLDGVAAEAITAHNLAAFHRHGFSGTPAFVLSWQGSPAPPQRSWSGRTTSQFIHDALAAQPTPPVALTARPPSVQPRKGP